MHSIVENSEIKFHTFSQKYGEITDNILYDSDHFGILQMKIGNKNISKDNPIAILFNVDCSSSMSDRSKDGKTKIYHVIHTLKRILSKFADIHKIHDISIFVSVIAFDDTMHDIFDFVKITCENLESLKNKINKIEPLDCTNIELSLISAKNICDKYRTENPNIQMHHILLTDGDVTEGESDHTVLSNLVDKNYSNIFVGFGKDHNASLLNHLSNNIRSDYRFIDNIELSGIVYGEIIHNIIYNVIDVGRIVVKNGLIYDWKTNEWLNEISISNMASNCEKTFQIKTTDKFQIEIEIYGTLSNNSEELSLETVYFYPPLFDIEAECIIVNEVDLTPYAFRQTTQELLYEANDFSLNDNNHEIQQTIKNKLIKFLKYMMDYMQKTNKNEDKFMKLLCDDIYVTFRTIGCNEATMWIHNRQSSQGRQQTYTATPSRNDMNILNARIPPRARRQTNQPIRFTETVNLNEGTQNVVDDENMTIDSDISTIEEFNKYSRLSNVRSDSFNLDEPVDNYELSNSIDTPYITEDIIRMMQNIQNMNI